MKRITRRKLFVLMVCLIVFIPVFVNATGKNEPIVGAWMGSETDPIHLEIREDGTYIKYQESSGKSLPSDEGKWAIEDRKLVFHTTLGLDGEVSQSGLFVSYKAIKKGDKTSLKIGTGKNLYFEGIKQESEVTVIEK